MSQKSHIKSSSYFLEEKEHFVINKNKEMDVCVKWFIPVLTTFGYVCFLPNPQVAIHSTDRSVTRCPPRGFPQCTSLSPINLPCSLEYYLCSLLGRVVIWNWKLKLTVIPNPQDFIVTFIWKLKAKIFSLYFILWEKLEMLIDSKTGRFFLTFPTKKPPKGWIFKI